MNATALDIKMKKQVAFILKEGPFEQMCLKTTFLDTKW